MSSGEPYIPRSRAEVVQIVADGLPPDARQSFLVFAKLLTAWYHHLFHERLERLKSDYEALQRTDANNGSAPRRFAAELDAVARAANFSPISQRDLDQALAEESVFKLRLFVDFADFSEIVFYSRGASQRSATLARWFGLRKNTIVFTNYSQVLVYIRFQSRAYFGDQRELPFEPGSAVLKLFQNIPKADLEMLFPNTVIRMRLTDKLVIGIPAFFSGVIVLTTKLGASAVLIAAIVAFWLGLRSDPVTMDQTSLVALATGAGALGAYLWKQFSNFKNRKIRFMKTLAESLYFKNMDNHAGVLANIIDYAEESECKEVMLAYGELLISGPMNAAQLSHAVQRRLALRTEFDIHDAIAKLHELTLLRVSGDQLAAVPLAKAIGELDSRWDAIFTP